MSDLFQHCIDANIIWWPASLINFIRYNVIFYFSSSIKKQNINCKIFGHYHNFCSFSKVWKPKTLIKNVQNNSSTANKGIDFASQKFVTQNRDAIVKKKSNKSDSTIKILPVNLNVNLQSMTDYNPFDILTFGALDLEN